MKSNLKKGYYIVTDENLHYGTTYSYNLIAVNAVGNSSPSLKIVVYTRPIAPKPPQSVHYSDVSQQSVRISWVVSNNGGESIQNSTIQLNALINTGRSVSRVIIGSLTSAWINGLDSGKSLSFKRRIVNGSLFCCCCLVSLLRCLFLTLKASKTIILSLVAFCLNNLLKKRKKLLEKIINKDNIRLVIFFSFHGYVNIKMPYSINVL